MEVFQEALSKIDLTKSQRDRAETLYTNICKKLEETGLDINFYPQGSFATRTVVRPFSQGKDRAYDVDVICEVQSISKDGIRPSDLMQLFKTALDQAGYKDYTQHDKCFTVYYADQDGVDFSIDIIPCVPESNEEKNKLLLNTAYPQYVESSIAIPNVKETKTNWITNNPIGYTKWFDAQVGSFEKIFNESYRGQFFDSIEELPEDRATNLLRNVIKIMKRLRDIFYSRKNSDYKPSSIVISTLVASLAPQIGSATNELDLLSQVINQLRHLKEYKRMTESSRGTESGYAISDIVLRKGNKWIFMNPANGLDNILSSWNEDSKRAQHFFDWIENLTAIIEELSDRTVNEMRRNERLLDSLQLTSASLPPSDFQVSDHSVPSWRTKA